MKDQRTQARLHVRLPALLYVPSEPLGLKLTVLDLSWGGALGQLEQTWSGSADQVVLQLLPPNQETPLSLFARILRRESVGQTQLIALRFIELSLTEQQRLGKLLAQIATSDPVWQISPKPLCWCLEIIAPTVDRWSDLLEGLPANRLFLQSEHPLTPGQSVAVRILDSPAAKRLILRGLIRGCFPQQQGYLLFLAFEHPPSALSHWANWFRRGSYQPKSNRLSP